MNTTYNSRNFYRENKKVIVFKGFTSVNKQKKVFPVKKLSFEALVFPLLCCGRTAGGYKLGLNLKNMSLKKFTWVSFLPKIRKKVSPLIKCMLTLQFEFRL